MGLLLQLLFSVLFATFVPLKSQTADDKYVITSSLLSKEIYVYKGDVANLSQTPSIVQWTWESTILNIDIDTTNSSVLFLDLERSCVYTVNKFASNSFGKEIHCGISKSLGSTIAYDWVTKNLYWSDGILQWIAVQPLFTTDRHMYRVLVQDLTDVSALAVDPINRYIFWFDDSPTGGRIERASLSGQQREAILTKGVLLVYDIVADVTSERIFWVDYSRYSIESANYEGLQRLVLYKRKQFSLFALAVDEDVVCSTLPRYKLWLCVDKRDGDLKYYKVEAQRMSYGIAIYNKALQPQDETNVCAIATCEHFCINGEYGATCLCKEGYTLKEDSACSATHGLFGKGILIANDKEICILDFRAIVHGNAKDFKCVHTGLRGVKYLEVNMADYVVFYYDSNDNIIKSYDIRHKKTDIIQKTAGTVLGLSYDWLQKVLYWCESSTRGMIGRLSVPYDFSEVFAESRRPITDVSVDPHNRVVFWIEDKTNILRSQMNDGETQKLLEDSSKKSGLFYEVKFNRLFWIQYNRIISINVDGSDKKEHKLITKSNQLKIYKSYFMWVSGTNTLQTVPTTSDHSVIRTITLTNNETITGIAVFDEDNQPMEKGACDVNNGGCDHICIIVSNGRVCKCKFGFTLDSDSTSCQSEPLNQDCLLATDLTHARIYQIALKSGSVTTLDLPLVERPVTVRYDSAGKILYWTEANRKQITRTNNDGKNWEIIYSSVSGTYPERIELDQNNGHLYFTASDIESSNKGYIGMIDLSSLYSKTLFTGLGNVFGLSLLHSKGILFFSNYDGNSSYIYRAVMGGSFKAEVFKSKSPIFDLAIDYKTDHLYWSISNELWSSDFFGMNKGMLLRAKQNIQCILPVNPYIYYSSDDSQGVKKIDTIRRQVISWTFTIPEIGLLTSLDIVAKEAQPVTTVAEKDSNNISWTIIAPACSTVPVVAVVVLVIICRIRRRRFRSNDHGGIENICRTVQPRNQPPIALTETEQLPPTYAELTNMKQLSAHTAVAQLYGTTCITHSDAGNVYEELEVSVNPVPVCNGDNSYIHPVNNSDYTSLMPPRNPHPDLLGTAKEESKNI